MHLFRSETDLSWIMDIPPDTWHLSGEMKNESDWCLDSLLALNAINIDTNPPEKFINAMQLLLPSGSASWPPPWQQVMPQREHDAFIRTLVSKIDEAIANINTRYYKSTWVKQNLIFNSLRRPRIDGPKWRSLVVKNPQNRMIRSFVPQEDGLARPIVYGRNKTRTGRLTVVSGPQILTLNKDFRDIILPRDDDHMVGLLDFNACEMRVLLYEAGFNCDEPDLYGMIKRVHLPKIERNVVKGAVIGRAYGLSKHVWGEKVGVKGRVLNHVDDTLTNLFDTSFLLRRVQEQYNREGFIRNRYDRRIEVEVPLDHMLINTYAQSTGNEVALLGFSLLLDRLASLGAIALYLLHDALIIDFPKSNLEEIKKITTVKVPGYVQKYFLKFEVLSRQEEESKHVDT